MNLKYIQKLRDYYNKLPHTQQQALRTLNLLSILFPLFSVPPPSSLVILKISPPVILKISPPVI